MNMKASMVSTSKRRLFFGSKKAQRPGIWVLRYYPSSRCAAFSRRFSKRQGNMLRIRRYTGSLANPTMVESIIFISLTIESIR